MSDLHRHVTDKKPWAWTEARHHIEAAKTALQALYPMDSVAHSLLALCLIQSEWVGIEKGRDEVESD